MKKTNRELGMDRAITRRDFLNGASVAIGGSLAASSESAPAEAPAATERRSPSPGTAGPQSSAKYYPPRLTGMRGSHEGSYETAHEMRYGSTWDEAESTAEHYDLIVVGGGLSGLSAAYFFRKALPEAKVLILDNHDDFGGHAKRNEYEVDGRVLIGYGGTEYITGAYTPAGLTLFDDIGLDAERFRKLPDFSGGYGGTQYPKMGLQRATFFDSETFGTDRLVVGTPGGDSVAEWTEFLASSPLSAEVQRDILRIHTEKHDYLPGLSLEEKIERLRKMSYQDYLLDVVKATPDVIPYFLRRSLGGANGAAGIDAHNAWSAFRSGFPGLDGLGIELPDRSWLGDADNPVEGIHFPDGNAGIARLLVRWLIPEALPGHTMEDSVATPVSYAALDEPGSPVRIRLSSTVVNAEHVGERRTASEVEVTYVQDNKAYRARGGTCVMACYNAMVPYICRDLPEQQKEALRMAVRKPLMFTNVLIRDWRAFHDLGVRSISCPGGYHTGISLDWGVGIGEYRPARTPDEPMVLHLTRTPIKPGLPARDQFRAGREEMLQTSFETIERSVRDQLTRALDGSRFDAARDISAITVNRWPHGYAAGGNGLFDPEWSYEEAPWVRGRKRFGRITIANSDAAAVCLTQAAFDQAHRAVQELLTDVVRPEFQYPWAERT